jgi:DNA-binding CsgD family transcriptional regulator
VSEPLLRAVVTRSVAGAFDAALAEVEATGLLRREAAGLLAFRHDLFRESVYAATPLAERRRLHRRTADLLAATHDAPARVVAAQLLGAGAVVDALPHLVRAADAAVAAGDLGNAVAHLRTAVEVCPPELPDHRVELAERAVVAAIATDDAPAALAIVDRLLSVDLDPVLRGRLLLARARVVTFAGDFAARIADLSGAHAAFVQAGDDVGAALSLAETALPVADVLPLAEHVRQGRAAVAIAERSGDPRALALALGNLAAAELMTGNAAAFDLWHRACDVATTGPADPELTFRVRQNLLQALLTQGRYAEFEAVRRERSHERTPALRAAVDQYQAVLRWRRGEWDAALAAAERSAADDRAGARATSAAVAALVSFERDRRPDITPLADAARFLLDDWDELWAPLAVAGLAEVRAIRREPRPERGVAELLRRIRATGAVVGWEDLLTVPVLLTGSAGARVAALLDEVRPVGPRAGAAVPFALGVRAAERGDDGAAGLLVSAAEAFLALGEPYPAARAYVAAARARRERGRRAGDLRTRAATLFRDIGADRSLAALLRSSAGSRALEGFRVPDRQRHAATAGLTERERDVADLARWGHTAREIADRLGIADSTVRTHLDRVKTKLGARRARDLVRLLGDVS